MGTRIHFCKGTLTEYQDLLKENATDPDTLYFCSVSGGGFHLFFGSEPLMVYTPSQDSHQ